MAADRGVDASEIVRYVDVVEGLGVRAWWRVARSQRYTQSGLRKPQQFSMAACLEQLRRWLMEGTRFALPRA